MEQNQPTDVLLFSGDVKHSRWHVSIGVVSAPDGRRHSCSSLYGCCWMVLGYSRCPKLVHVFCESRWQNFFFLDGKLGWKAESDYPFFFTHPNFWSAWPSTEIFKKVYQDAAECTSLVVNFHNSKVSTSQQIAQPPTETIMGNISHDNDVPHRCFCVVFVWRKTLCK